MEALGYVPIATHDIKMILSTDSLTRDEKGTKTQRDVKFTFDDKAALTMAEQKHKFSPLTVGMKERVRRLRLDAGYSMTKGSQLLGVSRKQLEDIETSRDYGCHLDVELLAKVKLVYKVTIDELVGELDSDIHSGFYTRMRNRKAS